MTNLNSLDGFWIIASPFWGAALGASFYVLLKTQPYLVNRSYDPKYNAVYISRFIYGLVAGVILATALQNFLSKTDSVKAFTPGVLAILGGYAAEAVELILQRLVEILLAAVRGDGSEQAKTKATADQAAKAAKIQEILPTLETNRANDAAFNAALVQIRAVLKQSAPTQ